MGCIAYRLWKWMYEKIYGYDPEIYPEEQGVPIFP